MTLAETLDTHINSISTAEEWAEYKALIKNNKAMKYRVVSDRTPFKKGTEFILDDTVSGIEFSPHGSEHPSIGRDMLQKSPKDFQLVEQVQEGDYIKYEDKIYRIHTVKDHGAFPYKGALISGDGVTEDAFNTAHAKYKLSTHEIEQALIKEAKRRGYTKDNFKCLDNPRAKPTETNYNQYISGDDALLWHNKTVYLEGEWAEIVDQTPHIEINGKTIEVEDGTVKISCGDTIEEDMFKNFYAVVNKYDLDVHRKGEQINEQLQQIWDEMPQRTVGKPVEFSIEVSGDDIFKANSCGRMKL